MLNTFVQWATIVSPIIAVTIAALTCWLNNRDVKRQIESVKGLSQQTIYNTMKEVESIRKLAKLQIEASINQVELEIQKYRLLAEQARLDAKGIDTINNSGLAHSEEFRNAMIKKHMEEKPQRDFQLYEGFIQRLDVISKRLKEIKL
ncbi:MAG: hypothetical protein II559_09635 [Muribaculaceae bacterium]|nr:hypothetical protein [Muribaculaceae bacterium]MBQ2563660.1 hypothetical protein [Muribaculaceae bacterium]MDY6412883.1 hypothetical protein [Bacteroidales bacterium]